MNSLRYLPGEWYALVGVENVLLLPESTELDTVRKLWAVMNSGEGLETLLSELLATVGMKITALPDFAMVSHSKQTNVILRGAPVFEGISNSDKRQVDAMGNATWAEHRFASLTSWNVGKNETDFSSALDISHGIVRVSALCYSEAIAEKQSEPSNKTPEKKPQTPKAGKAEPVVSAKPQATASTPSTAEKVIDKADIEPEETQLAVASKPAAAPVTAAPKSPAAAVANEPKTPAPTVAAASGSTDPDLEDTKDPEVYEESVNSEELSLASVLLGKRSDPDTNYETEEPDNADTFIKVEALSDDDYPEDHEDTVLSPVVRRSAPTEVVAAPVNTVSSDQLILARVCTGGHPNPPEATSCRTCHLKLTGDATQVRQPTMGRMFVTEQSSGPGTNHLLTRSIIIGRQPSSASSSGPVEPKLMKVASPNNDISRSHVKVKIDGWHVELVDLGATNGTVLLRAGHSPRRLGTNESVLLLSGDVADLGDGVTLSFRDLP